MRPQEQPGYQVVEKTFRQDDPILDTVTRPLDRWSRLSSWLTQKTDGKVVLPTHKGLRNDYIERLALITQPEAGIDLKELEQAPLFEFDDSFPTYPPPDFGPGEEPALAPMSREQMRLLLARTLPESIRPFIMEHFTFKYDTVGSTRDKVPPGPKVEIDTNDNVTITFYRDNFITKGSPPARPGIETPSDSRYIWEFVDPTKIALFFGKLIGRMTLPNEENVKRMITDRSFAVTAKKDMPGFLQRINEPEMQEELKGRLAEHAGNIGTLLADAAKGEIRFRTNWQDQWEDFVGLCLTLPEVAKNRHPVAYEYYQEQLKNFVDPRKDGEAIQKLKDNPHFADFNTILDLRTDEEKSKDQPPSPQRSFFDHTIRVLNHGFAPFGWRITYSLPEDEERAHLLADDDKEVAKLIENYSEEMRDDLFAQILTTYPDFDTRGRNLARRYLLAFSKEGEFDEWRIFAWLYKFSRTYRDSRPVGERISEDDYRDLRMVHQISEKEGGRLGTGVVPYEAISVGDRYSPKPEFEYVKLDRAKYIQKIRKKIDAKTARGIFDANMKAFEQFKEDNRYIDFHAAYGQASLANILKYDRRLANEVSNMLNTLGVERVSADAKVLAEAYYQHYLGHNKQRSDYMAEEAIQTILHYEEELNRPPDIEEYLQESPEIILERADPEYIKKKSLEMDLVKQRVKTSFSDQLRKTTLLPDLQEQIESLITNDVADTETLKTRINQFIDTKLRPNTTIGEAADLQKREFQIFLAKSAVRKNLESLKKVLDYQAKLEPDFAQSIGNVADQLKNVREIGNLVVVPERLTQADYEEHFAKRGIKLDKTQEDKLEGDVTRYGTLIKGADDEVIQKERSEMVRLQLAKADEPTRLRIVADLAARGLEDFKATVETPSRTSSYKQRFNGWFQRQKIYQAKELEAVVGSLDETISAIDQAKGETKVRFLRRLTKLTDNLAKGLQYLDVELQGRVRPPSPTPQRSEG